VKWLFLDEVDARCIICGKELNEGYLLQAEDAEEWNILEERFGDPSDWFIGECCFGGYCYRPNVFFDQVIKPLKQKGKER